MRVPIKMLRINPSSPFDRNISPRDVGVTDRAGKVCFSFSVARDVAGSIRPPRNIDIRTITGNNLALQERVSFSPRVVDWISTGVVFPAISLIVSDILRERGDISW